MEISQLFPPGVQRPVFFIDECTVINDLDYVRFAAHILTLIGIIPVLMRTNPEISIFPKTSKIILDSQETNIPSCIIVSRLSATSKNRLEIMKKLILGNSLFSSAEDFLKFTIQIKFLYDKILPLERPWIAMQVHEWLVNHIAKLSKQASPVAKALNIDDIKALCSEIIINIFIKCKITYATFGPQDHYSTMKGKSHVPNGQKDFIKGQIGYCLGEFYRTFDSKSFSSCVNRHIEYLQIPEEGQRTFGKWTSELPFSVRQILLGTLISLHLWVLNLCPLARFIMFAKI